MIRAVPCLLLVACVGDAGSTASPVGAPAASPAPAVEPRAARPAVRRHLALVAPRHAVDVKAARAGRLVELLVKLGGRVDAGEVLARLDDSDLRHAVRLAEAGARAAAARWADGKHSEDFSRDRARQAELLVEHISRDEVAQRRYELRRAGAAASAAAGDLEVQRADLERLRAQVDSMTLRAPFAAEVAAIYRDPGQDVIGDEAIVRLVSIERLVRFAVDGDDAGAFAVGAPVELIVEPERTAFRGVVAAISPEIDAANMMIVEATIVTSDDHSPPRSGCRGHVQLVSERTH